MFWWKEIADLKRRLRDTESELQKEQDKAARLTGFISRLQHFGISPAGQAPKREFAEALVDSIGMLLKTEQVVLFDILPDEEELLPVSARGVAPETLARLRVRIGEGVLGQAAQSLKTVASPRASLSPLPLGEGVHRTGEAENFFSAPYLIIPLVSQASCSGLLLIAKPQNGIFTPEARDLAGLFAMQAALTQEDHTQHAQWVTLQDQVVDALMRAVEAKDSITHNHSGRTRALVRAVAESISLPEILIRQIEHGAYLHDVGKIGIDDAILRKPDKLTPSEYDVMKKHPAIGHRILQTVPLFRQVGAIVLYHQEWYNGAGYPEGLAGEEIPLGARIVQIIDAWDAMTSDRPYRKAMSKTAAISELRRQAGTQFDPKLIENFLRVIDRLEKEGISTTEQNTRPAVTAGPP